LLSQIKPQTAKQILNLPSRKLTSYYQVPTVWVLLALKRPVVSNIQSNFLMDLTASAIDSTITDKYGIFGGFEINTF